MNNSQTSLTWICFPLSAHTSGFFHSFLIVRTSYALFDMDGNQVPQELVSKVGEAFERILEEACSLSLSLSFSPPPPPPSLVLYLMFSVNACHFFFFFENKNKLVLVCWVIFCFFYAGKSSKTWIQGRHVRSPCTLNCFQKAARSKVLYKYINHKP